MSHIARDKTPRDTVSRYTCNCHAAGPGGGDTAATHGAVSRYVTVHSEGIWGLMIAWVTVGHLGVTVGHFRATAGHLRVIKGPLRVRN